jgi:uncharacterized OB-fold protein/acyl dehydratase
MGALPGGRERRAMHETETTDGAAFLARCKAFEGREVDALVAPDPVNQAMIRHWVEAIGDANPVYTDPEAAAASVHGEIIAPAVMLQAWTMPGLHGNARGPGDTNPQSQLLNLLDAAGFVGVVATNSEQEYTRMLHLGDRITARSVIDEVSEEKHTALGVGHFITTRIDYTDAAGEVVGTQRWRILKFRPGTGRGAPAGAPAGEETEPAPRRMPRPRPGTTLDNLFFFEGAQERRLLIQRCTACQALRHPPQPRCDRCGAYDWDTVEASGRGTVYSFVVNHHPQVPAFDYPLPIGLIELEEGTRLVAQIVDCPLEAIAVGMAVEVTWLDDDPDLVLPAFRPSGGAS